MGFYGADAGNDKDCIRIVVVDDAGVVDSNSCYAGSDLGNILGNGIDYY